jgi:vacuolar iron transporter family protein
MAPYEDKFHLEGGELIRQVTFGMNDGIVSIFALLAGVAGAGQPAKTIVITLLAAAIAGALSMAAGEYISGKGEREYFKHEIEQETLEIKLCPEIEKEELMYIYQDKGFSGDTLTQIIETITKDQKLWIKEMVIDELGVAEVDEGSGIKQSLIIFLAFILGSLFPVLPYVILPNVVENETAIFIIATIVTFGGLFLAGALKKFVTGVFWLKSGIEMLLVGLFAFGVSYIIGMFIPI